MNRATIPAGRNERAILVLRGHKVLLDADLANLYDVETKVLLQAVKRNLGRFLEDFMFQLDAEEREALQVRLPWLLALLTLRLVNSLAKRRPCAAA